VNHTYLKDDTDRTSCRNLRDLLLTFHDVTKLINSELEQKQLLHTILAMVTRVMGADNALLLHLEGPSNRMKEISSIGAWPLDVNLFSSISLEQAAHCLVEHRGFIRPDELIPQEVNQALAAEVQQYLQTVLGAPMETKGRITGMIFFAAPNRRYEKIELEVFCALASQAAIALENAALYERLQQKLILTREELQHTQAELIRSEKIASIVEMAMGVTHSIRNPVMTIGGLARQLAKELADRPKAGKKLEFVIQGADRLEKIVREFAGFAREDELSMCQADIVALVRQAVHRAEQQENAQGVEFHFASDYGELLCRHDPILMLRVFDEVLTNCLDAVRGHGRIGIRLKRDGQFVRLEITDNGRGIADSQLGMIFDPFFSTKTRSTGLGLTYVHRIIEQHGGTIDVRSEIGRETIFTIHIPVFEWGGNFLRPQVIHL